jgi:uncharacterized protein with ATP-grasp and redox domains
MIMKRPIALIALVTFVSLQVSIPDQVSADQVSANEISQASFLSTRSSWENSKRTLPHQTEVYLKASTRLLEKERPLAREGINRLAQRLSELWIKLKATLPQHLVPMAIGNQFLWIADHPNVNSYSESIPFRSPVQQKELVFPGDGVRYTQDQIKVKSSFETLIGEDMIVAQRWTPDARTHLHADPQKIAHAFVSTWTQRAISDEIDLTNEAQLTEYLQKNVIPLRIFPGTGRASRVSATGLVNKLISRPDGAETTLRQTREASNWGTSPDVIVMDPVSAYRLLKRTTERISYEHRVEITKHIAHELVTLHDELNQFAYRMNQAGFQRLSQKYAKTAGVLKTERLAELVGQMTKESRPDDNGGHSGTDTEFDYKGHSLSYQISRYVYRNLDWAYTPNYRTDVVDVLRTLKNMLGKHFEDSNIVNMIWERVAMVIMRFFVEYNGLYTDSVYIDPVRVEGLAGRNVIIAVGYSQGTGGALRIGLDRLQQLASLGKIDLLKKHSFVMPVYTDYASASLSQYPNPYLLAILQGLSNPEEPRKLPAVVIGAKSPLNSLPIDKGVITFKDSENPSLGVRAIQEWRTLSADQRAKTMGDYGKSLKEHGVKTSEIISFDGAKKAMAREPKSFQEIYTRYEEFVPTNQGTYFHALNAGIFLFGLDGLLKMIDEGVWTAGQKYDHPDPEKGKISEFWYTDLVEVAAQNGNWVKHIVLGRDAPSGLKDMLRVIQYGRDRQEMITEALRKMGVTVEDGAVVTLSSRGADLKLSRDLPRMFPNPKEVVIRGRVHLEKGVVVGGSDIVGKDPSASDRQVVLDGTDRTVILKGNTTVAPGSVLRGVQARGGDLSGVIDDFFPWKAEIPVPEKAVLLETDEVSLLRNAGVAIPETSRIYLVSETRSSLSSPSTRIRLLEQIFDISLDMEHPKSTDQVWLHGTVVISTQAVVERGTFIKDALLLGATRIGQGRSVSRSYLTDVVLESVRPLDGFNYIAPRVDRPADVRNSYVVEQSIPIGYQVHDSIVERMASLSDANVYRSWVSGTVKESTVSDMVVDPDVTIDNNDNNQSASRSVMKTIVSNPNTYIPGNYRIGERNEENRKGLLDFMTSEIVGMFEAKIENPDKQKQAIESIRRLRGHPAVLTLTNEEYYQIAFVMLTDATGQIDPFHADKRESTIGSDARTMAAELIKEVDSVFEGGDAEKRDTLFKDLLLVSVQANLFDQQSPKAVKLLEKIFKKDQRIESADDINRIRAGLEEAIHIGSAERPESQMIDHRDTYIQFLKEKGEGVVLFLVDNAEETELDAALWYYHIRRGFTVAIGAASGSARGDSMVKDVNAVIEAHEVLREARTKGKIKVIGTGSKTYGTLLNRSSKALARLFENGDRPIVIVSKGQANLYTTLARNELHIPAMALLLSKGSDAKRVTGVSHQTKGVPVMAFIEPDVHLIEPDPKSPTEFRGGIRELAGDEKRVSRSPEPVSKPGPVDLQAKSDQETGSGVPGDVEPAAGTVTEILTRVSSQTNQAFEAALRDSPRTYTASGPIGGNGLESSTLYQLVEPAGLSLLKILTMNTQITRPSHILIDYTAFTASREAFEKFDRVLEVSQPGNGLKGGSIVRLTILTTGPVEAKGALDESLVSDVIDVSALINGNGTIELKELNKALIRQTQRSLLDSDAISGIPRFDEMIISEGFSLRLDTPELVGSGLIVTLITQNQVAVSSYKKTLGQRLLNLGNLDPERFM